MESTGVLVLGMHRSGTSAAARVLTTLGLSASRPDDAVRGPWNPKGHYESQAMMHLDNRLLAEMGCTWWSPPPSGMAYGDRVARITVSARQARQVFRRAYPRKRWVWKDPRACLLLPFWRRVLGHRTPAVIVLRNPLEVAASLERRNAMAPAFSVALWARYHRLLLEHTRGMPALVTRFDDLIADPARWAETSAAFLTGVGLPPPHAVPGALEDSVDTSLRHSRHGRGDLEREAPQALALFDAWEALVGTWVALDPPDLGGEPTAVQIELDTMGPDNDPGWRPPPWATPGGADAGTPAADVRKDGAPWT